tara:strand:- start:131 stop:1354 length:1224 start_codon:yes stop_codon:yes gene_type:complete
MNCRFCNTKVSKQILDLGKSPPSNAYLKSKNSFDKEKIFPLKLFLCEICFLVQTEDYNLPNELFTEDYAYFSTTSNTFVKHARDYVENITADLNLNHESFVIEIASNDGYLLRNFLYGGIPCLGIEPTKSTYLRSLELKIPTLNNFFNSKLAEDIDTNYKKADLVIANNVYAHVPEINDFTIGIKKILKENGTVTLEFPHLLNLIKYNLFDTVYHEHYSYLSLFTVKKIFSEHGLKVYNVDKIPTHGGSLRIYGCHENDAKKITENVDLILNEEKSEGLLEIKSYEKLQINADKIKLELQKFLIEQKNKNKIIVGYGAAAKGNTLLNFCDIKNDMIDFVCDASLSKQNQYLPGSHIEIMSPNVLFKKKIDYIFILPWNIKDEILKDYGSLKNKGVIFFTVINGIKFL